MKQVEKWGVFEASFHGNDLGNPFLDYDIQGVFSNGVEEIVVDGFYDGEGIYKVRFMPEKEGIYTYEIKGSFANDSTVEALTGEFEAIAPSENNHGRVVVVDEKYLGYEDGTPYYSMGTTCYAWANQSMELQEETLESLKNSPFNKIRFCFFPKYYDYNRHEPITHPFERGNGEGCDPERVKAFDEKTKLFPGMQRTVLETDFNYLRPNTEHFKRFDLRISQLCEMGIEADMILMHPYDKWGNVAMSAEASNLYLKYVLARYGAYRNIWWSLANEYDLMVTKSLEDWEHYAALIVEKDVYKHLRSIHNCMEYYDYSKPWITHCSVQRVDFYRTTEFTTEFLEQYRKPVVWDEICYEGNIQIGWGNITGKELVRRFWEAFMRGGHAGHGETFLSEDGILWWSHGGKLKGESVPRIQFLLDILKETPGRYVKKVGGMFDEVTGAPSTEEKGDILFQLEACGYELHYLGITQPAYRDLFLPEGKKYQVDVIDTWNMTITDAGVHSGHSIVELPQKEYMAIRLKEIK